MMTFLFGKNLEVSGGVATLFGRFPADRPKFRPGHGGDPQVKNPKNAIFSILSKFVLDDSRYQIRLSNHSRTSKMSYSGHISISRTISATLRKIDFLAKNHDFC